jgi:predicted Fe-Mo cluster-binding NifX family protein
MLVETPSRTWKAIRNGNDHHDHGHCNPITMFSDERPDAIVCLNIGAGAITRLGDMGVGVFKASARSVEEAVDLFEKGECVTLTEQDGCTAHR